MDWRASPRSTWDGLEDPDLGRIPALTAMTTTSRTAAAVLAKTPNSGHGQGSGGYCRLLMPLTGGHNPVSCALRCPVRPVQPSKWYCRLRFAKARTD